MKCTTVLYDATVTGTKTEASKFTAKDISLIPTFSSCTGYGQNLTFAFNGCTYTLTPLTHTKPSGTATVEIICPAGKEIVVTGLTTGCTIKIPGQTPVNDILDFTDVTGNGTTTRVINAVFTVGVPAKAHTAGEKSGIRYTSSGGACGASGENGSYTGGVTLQGFVDPSEHKAADQRGIWLE